MTDRVIVVAGEALVDVVLGDDGGLTSHPGGGPFNAARAIGRLGQPVSYLGPLSTDRFGARLRRELDADGVRLDAVVETDDPTTLALAEVDAGGSASYRFYVEGTSAPGLSLRDAVRALPGMGVLYVGTLGLVFEPMAATLEQLVERVAEETLVALDPNCRPSAIPDPAGYRERLSRMLGRTDVVKASEDDLAWLEPGSGAIDAARALLRRGPRVALVTRGAAGALVVTRTEAVEVPAPPVTVVDTIGAGDAFGGGFLAWWRGRDLGRADLGQLDTVTEATRFACRVAAITCARRGAEPPRLAELAAG